MNHDQLIQKMKENGVQESEIDAYLADRSIAAADIEPKMIRDIADRIVKGRGTIAVAAGVVEKPRQVVPATSTAGRRGRAAIVTRGDRAAAQVNQEESIAINARKVNEVRDQGLESRLTSASEDGAAIAREETTAKAAAYFGQLAQSDSELFELANRVSEAQSAASIGDAVSAAIKPTFGNLDLSFLGSAS